VRVTAKSDYALRALIEIARRTDASPVSAEEIGRLQDIPHGFLQAILADLRRAGVLVAQRGQSGGWRMGKDADAVTVADVIRAVDGPLVSIYGLRPEAVEYNDSARSSRASRSTSARIERAVSPSISSNGPVPSTSSRPSTSKRLTSMSLRLLL
jgi:Rrf2 family protein